jgi:hypothetical protein
VEVLIYAAMLVVMMLVAIRSFTPIRRDTEIVYAPSQSAGTQFGGVGCLPIVVALLVAVAVVLSL